MQCLIHWNHFKDLLLNVCFSNPTVLCSCKEENCVLFLWGQKETSQCCVFDRLLCCEFPSPTLYLLFILPFREVQSDEMLKHVTVLIFPPDVEGSLLFVFFIIF